jgi:hypothetical protein
MANTVTARLILGSLVVCSACGVPKADNLTVAATIEAPAVTLAGGALGSAVSGTFTLSLVLGDLASSGSQVTVQSFAVVDPSTQAPLVQVELDATATRSIYVDVGTTQLQVYNWKNASPLTPAQVKTLCAAKQVAYAGAVLDGTQNKTTPAQSDPFTVTGCPQ